MFQEEFLPEGYLIDTQKNKQYISSETSLIQAASEGTILEAQAVMCDKNHNLIVRLGDICGIIPHEDAAIGISSGSTREIAVISRVGKPVCFKVLAVNDDNGQKTAILSRRLAQENALEYFMNNLTSGQIIRARVTHLEPFGAFVDIGCGIISLIGIENISVSRISHPSDRFIQGQDIYAVVSGIDKDLRRVSLTHKELLGTWEQNIEGFSVGETVRGIVRDTPDYGVFIELAPNLSGLAESRENLRQGQQVSVYIKSIIPERMKIKLIIIDSLAAPEPISKLKYYIPETPHIALWTYTPECCETKVIQTYF